jgi:peptidoglycan/LPS O-acetylase OafA/YrhL
MTMPSLALHAKTAIPTGKTSALATAGARDASLDYLRAFIVLLVLVHHSVLAYAIMWPAQPKTFAILSSPIIDPQRFAGFDLLVIFNDTFFMALMFLLSGLFVWPGLERKGAAKFLRDRLWRLGVPFVVAAGILMPLAYYPSYAVTTAEPGLLAYARAWLSLGFWPGGPAWFIWLLLVFDAVAAWLYVLRHRWPVIAHAPRSVGMHDRVLVFVAVLLGVSALVFLPMALIFGADRWLTFGPFSFQASRPLLYATFFLAGVWLGASGTESGLLARSAGLARQWPIWVSAGLVAYALRIAVVVGLIVPVVAAHRPLPLNVRLLSDLTVVLCCVTISVAFLAMFRRFVIAHRSAFDSLSASSYGMYLVHYPIVVWLQFALLAAAPGPIAKSAIVSIGAIALSWGLVVALRRVPLIARVL